MSKGIAWLCVVFTACSVYEPSLLGTGRNAAKGGAVSGGGSSGGGPVDGGDGGDSVHGGSTSGGTLTTGRSPTDAGAAGDPRGGNAETGGAGATSGGSSAGGSESGGNSGNGALASGGKSSGGVSSDGGASGGAITGGATAGGGVGGAGKAGSGGTNTGGTTGGQSGGKGGGTGVLFSDDFETGNASAWTPNTSGDFSVVTDGSLVYRQNTVVNALRASSVGSAAWQDQAVQARVKVLSFGGTSTSSSYLVAVYARYTDEDNHYYVALRSDGKISIRRKLSGGNTSIGSAITPGALITTGKWYTVKLEVSGTTLNAYIDGVLYDTVVDTSLSSGKAGVGTNNASAVFDDFVVSSP